jgi:hypothetical protein
LGRYQSEFELRTLKGENPIDILDDLGLTKICCRTNMLYPPTFPVIDANVGRIIDDTTSRKSTYIDGPELFLDKVPDFPQNEV